MTVANYIVKATYGAETRKWKVNGYGIPKYLNLIDGVRRAFGIEGEKIHLKYKDSDGDIVELSSDADLELAIEVEKSLKLVVVSDSDDLQKTSSTDLNSSPVKSEPIDNPATLAVTLDEVNLNETKYEKKQPAYSNDVQSFLGQQPQLPPAFGQQPQLPPAFGQQQFQPNQPQFGQNPGSALPPAPLKPSTYSNDVQSFLGQQPQLPPSGFSQQSQLPPAFGQQQMPSSQQSAGFGQQQMPSYAPVKLTPGWNNPPSAFFHGSNL